MSNLSQILDLASSYEQNLPSGPAASFSPPQGAAIAGWIDHTLLKPETTPAQIYKLCEEARLYNFASVCVNPLYVPLAKELLAGAPSLVCAVVGFPLGATLQTSKVFETLACLEGGAGEIDMVLQIGALKGGAYGQVLNDIQSVVQAAHRQGAKVKVILETVLLSDQEKIIACLLSKEAGADFVKTSTGFGPAGAKIEDVALMRRVVGAEMGVKAAGGIRSLADAVAMIQAGANRLGTSAGVQIIREAQRESG
jgi:deoxyribose-phosphate aldolase